MGWIEDLRGRIVGVDTAPFIYYIERNAAYVDIVDPFFYAVHRGEFTIVTSIVTLLETLVLPTRKGNIVQVEQYKDQLLHTRGLTTLTLSQEIAEEAARLRALYNLRTPDSIQMATAIDAGASFFLTNDAKLPSLPTLQVLMVDRLRTNLQN